jgi:phytoene synthase
VALAGDHASVVSLDHAMSARRDRRRLVAAARRAIMARAPALAFATRLLDRRQRQHLRLLYFWCRVCADLVRGPDTEAGLVQAREKTVAALGGSPVGDPAFDALALLISETGLPDHYPRLVLDGLAMDAADFRPRHEEELFGYCHRVAGVPAVMAAIMLGVSAQDAATLGRAADLAIGCRLAALARDISADAAADRCYLPDDWLSEMDIPPGEHMKPPYRKRLAVLAVRLASRAEAFIGSAREGVAALPFRLAWVTLTVIAVHRDILEDVIARGEHGWDHRPTSGSLDRIDKGMISAILALLRRKLRPAEPAELPWRADQAEPA